MQPVKSTCWRRDDDGGDMKALYLDIFSGISGDMFLGAMIDLGVEADALKGGLAKLKMEGYHLHLARGERGAMAGTKFDVHLEEEGHGHSHGHHHHHGEDSHGDDRDQEHVHEHGHGRTFGEIRSLIQSSSLSDWVKGKAVAVFQRVAVAEGKIHGQPAEKVHFHEVGAVDSIVDIVGACIALDLLGRPRVFAGPALEGTGTVRCAHGEFPLPAPATLEILKDRGASLSQCDEPGELITPTGAAILAEFAETFGPMRGLKMERIGYGLGTRHNKTRPNVLRAVLGEVESSAEHDWETDAVAVLETNLDDINAELLGGFVERALAEGALDVFQTPVQMKKNRPGILLTVLCPESEADRLTELMLRETTAFGVRRTTGERRKLRRESTAVATEYGEVTVKIGRLDGAVVQVSPEYESCRRAAERTGAPLKQVYLAALRGAQI